MDKNKIEKHPMIISYIALIVSIGHLVYYVIYSEIGPLNAKPNYYVTVSNNIKIENELGGVTFSPFITFVNNGKKEGYISKISATLELENSYNKNLIASSYLLSGDQQLDPSPFSIQPKGSWSGRIYFTFMPLEDDLNLITKLDFKIGNSLLDQYLLEKNNNKPYQLPEDILKEVGIQLKKNASSIKTGNYTIIINVFEKPDDIQPVWSKKYNFRLSDELIKGLTDYQFKAYKVPPKLPMNVHMHFVATPALIESK